MRNLASCSFRVICPLYQHSLCFLHFILLIRSLLIFRITVRVRGLRTQHHTDKLLNLSHDMFVTERTELSLSAGTRIKMNPGPDLIFAGTFHEK